MSSAVNQSNDDVMRGGDDSRQTMDSQNIEAADKAARKISAAYSTAPANMIVPPIEVRND